MLQLLSEPGLVAIVSVFSIVFFLGQYVILHNYFDAIDAFTLGRMFIFHMAPSNVGRGAAKLADRLSGNGCN